MDAETIKYYSNNYNELADTYNSTNGGICNYFNQAFSVEDKVIDIGCGSGRDLNKLIDLGFDAFGIDACPEWIEHLQKESPRLKNRVSHDSLPNLTSLHNKSVDGILCSAVLMHLPKEELFDCVFNLKRILKKNGKILLSIPVLLDDENINSVTNRDTQSRLFNGITPDNLQLLFERLGFVLISQWDSEDTLARKGRKWSTMLFKLSALSGTRPIDTIESILNNDAKIATYKLALFRALADIAITNYNIVKWQFDGKVKIKTETIANKWIEYYWSIVESEKRIPQTSGRSIAFRKPLEDLVDSYKSCGGISRFCIELRNNNLSLENSVLYSKLLSKLKGTIWNQPVRYAGGGNDFSVFQYDKTDQTVIIGSDIWRELSLTGTWILDATILRWAELTSQISKGDVKISEAIDLLLINPLPAREVNGAKIVYDKLLDKKCVWSEKSIENKYDVDHAIPYALWHNNDLWNLLPSNPAVNSSKRDKLPTNNLVKKRKKNLIYYWEVLRKNYEYRFKEEIDSFCGEKTCANNWENKLFNYFAEAIEIAAIQRGVERWEP